MDTPRYTLASLLFMMTIMLSSCGASPSNNHSPTEAKAVAYIRFYEGLWASQSNICTVVIFSIPYTYEGGRWDCPNDEAKSLKLQNIPAGSMISVYDSRTCGDDDDYSVITVKKSVPEIIVGDFTHGVVDQDAWSMWTHYDNGIAGKVSCAIVDIPGPHPAHVKMAAGGGAAAAKAQPANGTQAVAFVRWYRGLNLEQDNFCTVDIPSQPYYLRTKFDDYHCKNDVAQSVELENIPPGTVLYVYDSPNCSKTDDWGQITVLKQAARLQVGDFNHTFTDPAGLQYDGHYYNGINGKLSCFILDVPDRNGRHAEPGHDK